MVAPLFARIPRMSMTRLSIALWATNLTPRLNRIDARVAAVDAKQ
jgi:hypothetical protein